MQEPSSLAGRECSIALPGAWRLSSVELVAASVFGVERIEIIEERGHGRARIGRPLVSRYHPRFRSKKFTGSALNTLRWARRLPA
jgi:hypothetical protein